MSEFFTKLSNVLESFGFADFLDIVLVAFIAYNSIKLLRETRAFQLIKGLLFCLIAYGLVNLFNLQVSTYLFRMIFNNIILVLIILFQPEIRHALESAGRSGFTKISFIPSKKNDEQDKEEKTRFMINSFVRASEDMSEKKIGALIVFERSTMLGEIISTGTIIDAAPTMQMFSNIFFPKAPLHDGAAIVRDARIFAAGCILPLTENKNLSKELGTRHRAALGMSEQCDAVVVVISEETGYISVALKGVLNRDISGSELYDILEESLIKQQSSSSNDVKPSVYQALKRLIGGSNK